MQTRFHKKGFLRLASFESEWFWTSEVAYRRKKDKRIVHRQASEVACSDSFQVPIFLTF